MINYKIIISIICFSTLGIVSCSACSKQDQSGIETPTYSPTPAVSVPSTTTVVINNSNLEVTLPNNEWKPLDVDATFKGFVNTSLHNMILLSKSDLFNSIEQYTLETIRAVKETGATIASVKQVEINNYKFIVIESSKNDIQAIMWLTLDNKFSYMVTCGGPTNVNLHALCNGIINTVKIN